MSSEGRLSDSEVAPPNYSWQERKTSSPASPSIKRADLEVLNSNDAKQYHFFQQIFGNSFRSPVSSELISGAHVLYVNAGNPEWVKEMSKAYPNSHFECITIINILALPEDLSDNVKYYSWDIQEKTSYSDSVFDFINVDALMLHLRTEEWPVVFQELLRILKRGGYIELLESETWGGNMGPTNEIFMTTLNYSLRARGIYTRAGRELGKLLKNAGYTNINHHHVSVPCGWGTAVGKAYGQLVMRVTTTMIPFLMKSLGWTEERLLEEYSKMQSEWVEHQTYNNFYVAYAQKP